MSFKGHQHPTLRHYNTSFKGHQHPTLRHCNMSFKGHQHPTLRHYNMIFKGHQHPTLRNYDMSFKGHQHPTLRHYNMSPKRHQHPTLKNNIKTQNIAALDHISHSIALHLTTYHWTVLQRTMSHQSVQLMLLSYHRCLIMISEALKLCVEGGQVSHIWCIGVVSHGYGGLGGGRDGGGGWYACRTKLGGWSHVCRCRSTSRVRGDALMTPDRTVIQVRSSR